MSLKDDIENDLDGVFFREDDFAEVALYHPSIGDSYEVKGIFDDTTETPSPQGEGYAKVISRYMRFQMREADIVDEVRKEDWITIRGVDLYIIDFNSDGTGTVTLNLQKQQ